MNRPDYAVGTIIDFKFTTRDSGAPSTLGGSPVVSVYKGNSTTQTTTGVTLTVDFDALTGCNHVRIDTSADATFYSAATDFDIVITTGTVGGTTVVAEVVGGFSLEKQGTMLAAAMVLRNGTLQAGTTSSVTLDASASATNNLYNGCLIILKSGTGAGQVRAITNYVGSTKIATVDRPFVTAPTNTTVYTLIASDNPALNASLQTTNSQPQTIIRSATAQTGSTSSTIKLDASASATNNIYNNDLISITSGTGISQVRTIIAYNGTTKVATVDKPWITTPDNTSAFNIYASTTPSLFSDQGVAQAGSSNTITLAPTASATNNVYNGSLLSILAGTDAQDTVEITAYNGTTKVATVSPNFAVTPDATSVYVVIPAAESSSVAPAPTVGQIAAAILATPSILIATSSGGKVAATIAAGDIAADAIDANALKADAVTEIQAGLSTLNAAGVRSAVGMASANLDAQLSALAAIPLNAAGVRSAVGLASANLDIQLASIGSGLDAAGVRSAIGLATANLDTQLSGINAKTTNLPSDPADQSNLDASFAATNATLATIAANLVQLGIAGTVDDGSPAAGSFNISNISAPTDSLVGRTLVFTSGARLSFFKTISADTGVGATRTLTFSSPFSAAPADGDSFLILH